MKCGDEEMPSIQVRESTPDVYSIFVHSLTKHATLSLNQYIIQPSSETDRNKIIQELTESKVFDYIPGRYHHTFKNITPHISSHIQVGKLMNHIHQTRDKISKHYKLK